MTQQEFFDRYKYSVKADRIGGGGFGTVYRATDKLLHRKVAVKVSEVKIVGDKEFSLKAEFDAVGKLPPHQNIAHYEELYSFESPQGVFDYAVMQYYEDGNLKQLLESRKLTFEQKEKIAEGILDGISFLHGNKVVHRDLKPANILICREGDDYVPLITDFGLSKGVEEMSKSGFTNSVAGGSPGYMSPEQIKGGIMQLNTDLWSYGVIVYELFSGRRLFQSLSPTGSTTEVNDMILHKDISNEIASLPEKWRKIVERCLVRDNKTRVKSADELMVLAEKEGKCIDVTLQDVYEDILINGGILEDYLTPEEMLRYKEEIDLLGLKELNRVRDIPTTTNIIDRSFSVFHLEGDNLVCYVDGSIFLYDITKVKNANDIFSGVCKPVLLGNENNIYKFIRNYITPKGKTIVSYCESLVDYVSAIEFVNEIRGSINLLRLFSDLQLIGLEMINIYGSMERYLDVRYCDSAHGVMSECHMVVDGNSGVVEINLFNDDSITYQIFGLDDASHLDLLLKGGAEYMCVISSKIDKLLLAALTDDIVLMSSRDSEELLRVHSGTQLPFKQSVVYESSKYSNDYIVVKVGRFESLLRFDNVCKNVGPHMSRFEDFSKFEYVNFYDADDEKSEFEIIVSYGLDYIVTFTIVNKKTRRGYVVDLSEIIRESKNDECNSEGYWYIRRCKFIYNGTEILDQNLK